MTWYRSEDDLPDINDYDIISNPRTYLYFDKPVQFPFGYGLSYTTFEYGNISVTRDRNGFTVTCNVQNTGKLDGDEVVQLYAVFHDAPVKAPVKQLVGFSRINIKHDETKPVIFSVPDSELRLFDENENAFSIIPAAVTFSIGASSLDFRLSEKVQVK